MTEEKQREYIIDEAQLKEIIYFAYLQIKDDDSVHEGIKKAVSDIRSRPYDPDAARKDERETVLKEIFDWSAEDMATSKALAYRQAHATLHVKIQSLRKELSCEQDGG